MRNSRFAAAVVSVAVSAALLAGPSAAHASTSLQECALGTEVPEIRGVYGDQIAAAEARYAETLKGLDAHARARARRVFAAGVAAYVYGLPQVTMRATVKKFLHNEILSVAMLADPSFKSIVTPNNDTAYTLAWFDLLTGPLVIDVPDTKDRYYVLQFLDAYTNNFAFIGRRVTGTKAGSYALVPPGWNGKLPAGVKRVDSPTNTVALGGRTVVNGDADMPAVKALISQIRATPLAAWTAGVRQPPVVLDKFPPTFTPTVIPTGPAFVEALNRSLRIDPPPAADACALAAMTAAGVRVRPTSTIDGLASEAADVPPPAPTLQPDQVVRHALEAATRAGDRLVDDAAEKFNAASRKNNQGWQSTTESWLGEFGENYLARAIVTRIGFAANSPAEAVYPIATTDREGRELNGAHKYAIRFRKGKLPPVDAFWSLTMYGADRFMYENEIKRYAIGDRTPGLRYERDGSLIVYIQHERPTERAKLANWLPAPAGTFRLVMRLYQPRRSVVTGVWKPGWVKRAKEAGVS
jgi:hypothetical protein